MLLLLLVLAAVLFSLHIISVRYDIDRDERIRSTRRTCAIRGWHSPKGASKTTSVRASPPLTTVRYHITRRGAEVALSRCVEQQLQEEEAVCCLLCFLLDFTTGRTWSLSRSSLSPPDTTVVPALHNLHIRTIELASLGLRIAPPAL